MNGPSPSELAAGTLLAAAVPISAAARPCDKTPSSRFETCKGLKMLARAMAWLLLTTCLACAPASDEGDRETADSGGMAQADATRSLGVVFELASTGQVTEGDPYADGPTTPAPCRGWGLEDSYRFAPISAIVP